MENGTNFDFKISKNEMFTCFFKKIDKYLIEGALLLRKLAGLFLRLEELFDLVVVLLRVEIFARNRDHRAHHTRASIGDHFANVIESSHEELKRNHVAALASANATEHVEEILQPDSEKLQLSKLKTKSSFKYYCITVIIFLCCPK